MRAVLKNNWHRLMRDKAKLILTLVLTAGAIVAALFVSAQPSSLGSFAVVYEQGADTWEMPLADITVLDEAPPLSELVRGRYDASIVFHAGGSYTLESLQNEEDTELLKSMLDIHIRGGAMVAGVIEDDRTPGATILGFLVMFVMMEGVVLLYLLSDDREQGQISRVAASPVSFTAYVGAHGLFALLYILLPTSLMLVAAKLCGANLGMGLSQHILLLLLLGAISTSFALFLNAFIKGSDKVNMLGSAVGIVTSILAGSLFSFEQGNRALAAMVKVLPQKAFLTVAEAVERGSGLPMGPLLYALGFVLVCTALAVWKLRRDYVYAK